MLVLSCLESDFNASTGECAAPFYTNAPGLFAGWSAGDFAEVTGAILVAMAIAFIIRLVIRWAEQQ